MGKKFDMITQRCLVWVTEYIILFLNSGVKKNALSEKDEFIKSHFEFLAVHFLCGRLSCRYKFRGQQHLLEPREQMWSFRESMQSKRSGQEK